MNKVILIGRAGKDPETQTLETGNKMAKFSLATSEKYKDNESTEWHNIVCFVHTAEFADKFIKKGDLLMVEGKIKTRSWEKDGVTRYTTEIIARDVQKLVWEKKTMTVEAVKEQAQTDELPF